MTKPVRLQLSRKRGFNLQELSRATNGLDAVNVARPTMWGNPFLVHPNQRPGRKWGSGDVSVPTAEDAVECYRLLMTSEPKNAEPDSRAYDLRTSVTELRGKNLACWCPLGDDVHCHASVLLEMANR